MNEKTDNKKMIAIVVGIVIALLAVIAGVIIFSNSPAQRLKKQLSLGERYLSELKYDEAVLAFEEALKIEPRTEAAYIGLANAYIGKEDYESALAAVERGIEAVGETENLSALKSQIEEKVKSIVKPKSEIGEGSSEESDKSRLDYYESLGFSDKYDCNGRVGREGTVGFYEPIMYNFPAFTSFEDMKAIHQPYIDELLEYAEWLENHKNEYPELIYDPTTKGGACDYMTGHFLNSPKVERNGKTYIELIDLASTYRALQLFYMITNDLDKCMEYRRKMVELGAWDESALQDGYSWLDANGSLRCTFDSYGRIIKRESFYEGNLTRIDYWRYENGRLVEVTWEHYDDDGVSKNHFIYIYDGSGRMIEKRWEIDNELDTQGTATYNGSNEVVFDGQVAFDGGISRHVERYVMGENGLVVASSEQDYYYYEDGTVEESGDTELTENTGWR